MAGSGSGGDVSRAQKPGSGQRRGHRQKAAWLPLDVIAEIAARSDPATLVRCAATCRDARRRIAEDPGLLGRLRLRDTERFVLPLLRGHLAGITTYTGGENINLYMVDTTGAANATSLVKATFTKASFVSVGLAIRNSSAHVVSLYLYKDSSAGMKPGLIRWKRTSPKADERLRSVSMDSRGGLVLVRTETTTKTQNNTRQRQKLVCNLATRRHMALPPEPAFPYANGSTEWTSFADQYVLLVGGSDGEGGAVDDTAVGRPFQVLKVKLIVSQYRSYRCLLVHTFSSEQGAWSPLVQIPTPNLHGSVNCSWSQRPLVVGDVVHWLCLTNSGSYMLILHVGAARVNVTSLPTSFPRNGKNMNYQQQYQYLLATATAGGNPIVLVADADKVSAWEQSKHTRKWKPRPQVVIENETILGFEDDGLAELVEKERRWGKRQDVPNLLCFGERSGTVLLGINGYSIHCLLWLDLHSKKIVRCFSKNRMQVYCPYEVDLSSWVPNFSNVVTL